VFTSFYRRRNHAYGHVRYSAWAIILVSLFAYAGSPAAGQGTVASIIGQVTDQSGAVLPGVTVTATSPALQVPQVTAVTNEVGEFRLSPLPTSDVVFPAQCFDKVELRVFNSVAPRLHAAYDLAGDGKTLLKGGWGRYDHMRQIEPDAWRLAQNNQAYGIFLWRDQNGDNDYTNGEVNRDPNGPDFVETAGTEFEETVPKGVVNPNEKQFKQDEFSVSLERELIPNFAIRATGVYTRTLT